LTTLATDFYHPTSHHDGAFKENSGMAGQNVVELTDQNFEQEVLKSEVPVLVDFWAEWCMPCRMLAPTIEKIAKDYEGKVKVGKVDTDANRDTALKYNISNIPTVILFRAGEMSQRFVGLRPERDFKEAIDAGAK
jgi:thioredoxin 1